MEKSRQIKYPLPDYLQQDREKERFSDFQLQRRRLINILTIGPAALVACGGIAWLTDQAAHTLRMAQCTNCSPSPDNSDALNGSKHNMSTATHEYNGIPYDAAQKLSPVTLPFTLKDGSQARADIIAPLHSTDDTIAPLLPGSAIFIALWDGTMQYGCLNGDVGWLRTTVRQDTAVFHDYLHPQQNQQSLLGSPGQVLWIDFDQQSSQEVPGATCNQPAYCIKPNENGELAYIAGILTPDVNSKYGAAFLDALLADSHFRGIPEETKLIASQVIW